MAISHSLHSMSQLSLQAQRFWMLSQTLSPFLRVSYNIVTYLCQTRHTIYVSLKYINVLIHLLNIYFTCFLTVGF